MGRRAELEMAVQDSLGFIGLLQEARAAKLLARYGLNRSQFTLLFKLGLEPDKAWTLSALVDHFEMNAPGMSKMVNQLAAKGWLDIELDTVDRRQKFISISAQGQRKRDETLAATMPFVARTFKDWKSSELQDFLQHLDKLKDWLDAHRDDL